MYRWLWRVSVVALLVAVTSDLSVCSASICEAPLGVNTPCVGNDFLSRADVCVAPQTEARLGAD